MTSTPLLLTISAAALAVTGTIWYLRARRSTWKSRAAALTLFGHGAVGTGGLLFALAMVHLHSGMSVHLHPIDETFVAVFACDLDWSCAAAIAAVVTALVLAVSFALSQIIARAMVAQARRMGARPLGGQVELAEGIFEVPDPDPDAYSVAILTFGGRHGLRAKDYVFVTTGLVALLSPSELRGVTEHELAHVRARDNRYLPYFHALASLIFFDPTLRHLRNRLSRRFEFEADESASRRTRDPRALARALLKVSEAASGSTPSPALLGLGRCREILNRIERLITLAESMEKGEA